MESYDLADPLPKSCYSGRLALEMAASSRENLLLMSPPGAGALMLARRLPGIMPELSEGARAAIRDVYQTAGIPPPEGRPFRAPHYSASVAGMLGTSQRVGEAQLARHGVLFLDNLAEYSPAVVRGVTEYVARALPGTPLLVGREYPSPCGFAPGTEKCECSDALLATWELKLEALCRSFPLAVSLSSRGFSVVHSGESSAVVRARVAQEWATQGFSG